MLSVPDAEKLPDVIEALPRMIVFECVSLSEQTARQANWIDSTGLARCAVGSRRSVAQMPRPVRAARQIRGRDTSPPSFDIQFRGVELDRQSSPTLPVPRPPADGRSAPGRSSPRSTASANTDQVDDEDEGLVGSDRPASAALAVPEHRWDRDPPTTADPHSGHTLIPASDDLAPTQTELEGAATVPRRVELLPGLPCDADVMHFDDAPWDSLGTVSDHDVLDLELIRRRLIGRHHDIRLLTHRHDPKPTGPCAPRRNTPLTQPRPAAVRSNRQRR